MSLSQKHSGKVVVPWFNIAEWIAVRQLIFDKAAENWLKALEILRIWKKRTPLLSAGIEGTLIILESLTADPAKLTQHQLQCLHCMSCVRFLNLCAANATRQGTFNQTAKDRDLPKELVGLRHDIAHGHKLPSLGNLQLALTKCLRYVEDKYWNVQLDHMKDFVIRDLTAEILDDLIYVFVHLTHAKGKEPVVVDKELEERIAKIVKQGMSFDKILSYVQKQLTSNFKRNPAKVVEQLYENFEICCITCGKVEFKEGKTRIPESTLKLWTPLLAFLYSAKLMPDFLIILFHNVFQQVQNEKHQEVASAWLYEIFKWLLANEQPENVDAELKLKYRKLQDEVLATLSSQQSNSINYISELLEFNGESEKFRNDILEVCNTFQLKITDFVSTEGLNDARIFTEEDALALFPDVEMSDEINENEEKETNKKWKWRAVKDTSGFRNLPLGVLPGQRRDWNPTMDILQ